MSNKNMQIATKRYVIDIPTVAAICLEGTKFRDTAKNIFCKSRAEINFNLKTYSTELLLLSQDKY